MNRLRRLDVRLFISYALVVLVGAATLVVTFSLLAPAAFDDHIRGMTAMGGMGSGIDSHQAFVDALRSSLPIATLVSVALAAVVAGFVARRILRPIDAVRRATARLVDGHYDERIQAPDELELAALAHDVNRLAATLETTEQRRGELVAEVAHEMRTPITVIDGYVEGLIDGVFAPTGEVFAAIGEETARLARLATDLGTLSRADEGIVDLRPERADLAQLVTRVTERLRPQFDAAAVALDVEPGDVLPVDVDEQRIAQVLTNLLGNALACTPPGGHVTVTVTARRLDGSAAAEVTDTGIGLTAEDAVRIFDRFYRVPSASRPGGSGIGLTIARSLARAHGGDLQARSAGPGQGATLTLTLPIAADA